VSHGGTIKAKVYLGLRPSVVDRFIGGKEGPHVDGASPVKVWAKPPQDAGDLLILPLEIELPEEAFLPTMPTINISIPIESVGGSDVKVDGGIKRIDVSKKVERKLS
jgi:hypothetical protein